MNRIIIVAAMLLAAAWLAGPALAGEPVPESVPVDNWAYRDVAELGQKYGAERQVAAAGGPCARRDLAECYLSVVNKVLQRSAAGDDAVPGEERTRLAQLHEALLPDLASLDAYQPVREALETLFAAARDEPFLLKGGVNGFIRGEGAGAFRLSDFSHAPGHSEGRFLYRVKPYLYWHPAECFDVHLEGQGYGFTGGGQYYGKVSLYQGFVEAKLSRSDLASLKIGRQEFSYGSTFILGPNGFFDGLVFDAVRLRLRPTPALSIDLLGGLYGEPFDAGLKGSLSGAYATYRLTDDAAVEAYGFHDTGSADHHSGEHLNSWGVRTTGKLGPVAVEFEPVYQSGRVFDPAAGGNVSISAYGGHLDLSVETTLAERKTTFLLGYAMGSGDRAAAAGGTARREFRTPANDSSLLGDMSVVGDFSGVTVNGSRASGIHDITAGWGIDLVKDLNVTVGAHYFLADEAPAGFSRDIGLETDIIATWALGDSLALLAAYDHFFTGTFFRDAGGSGDDIHYGYVMLQFDLGRVWPRRLKH